MRDDLEVLTAECEILRRRNQDSQDGETTLREQMIAQQRTTTACAGSGREKEREAESKLREAMRNQEMMQRLIDDKEEEFETRLKAQVVQWKTDWDNVEEGLKDEIKKLKTENDNLRSEAGAMRGRTMENSSRQQNQEKLEVERLLREDREKLRQLQLKLDTLEASKQSSERRVLSLSSTERDLRESKETLSLENEELRSRVKQRIEKTWLDKLKRSEESAAQDVSGDPVFYDEAVYPPLEQASLDMQTRVPLPVSAGVPVFAVSFASEKGGKRRLAQPTAPPYLVCDSQVLQTQKTTRRHDHGPLGVKTSVSVAAS
ncbi:hypothetical protein C7M84_012698 [Penaeus vannamei]|uniref:Uncharacterized protein n=1 Tax=Penaeus vannamei TaxID=6689 RepID=A0A3R7PK28_PENVA|nr:hypothetical protein C7M84_012698 [Penaeus vannamei]